MESKVFKTGNYIWECKSSYTDPGGSIDCQYIQQAIEKVETRWEIEQTKPSGYYYVFPVNLISNDARNELERFKQAYSGLVDIDYYDKYQVQRLISNLSKISDYQSLVNYIKSVQVKAVKNW